LGKRLVQKKKVERGYCQDLQNQESGKCRTVFHQISQNLIKRAITEATRRHD